MKLKKLLQSVLPTVKLSKFDELGHLTNFDKWSPNSIQNVPGPIELKFMPFFNKLCLQKVSNGSRKANFPIPKMVKICFLT